MLTFLTSCSTILNVERSQQTLNTIETIERIKILKEELYAIIHCIYGDICGDSYYGKEERVLSSDLVSSTKQKVEKAVSILNKSNNSYYPKSEPSDEFDTDFMDYDYYYYKKVEPATALEVVKTRSYKYRRKAHH